MVSKFQGKPFSECYGIGCKSKAFWWHASSTSRRKREFNGWLWGQNPVQKGIGSPESTTSDPSGLGCSGTFQNTIRTCGLDCGSSKISSTVRCDPRQRGSPVFRGMYQPQMGVCVCAEWQNTLPPNIFPSQQGDHPFAVCDGPTKRPQQMRISRLITSTYLRHLELVM